MKILFIKEFKSYFTSPIGYVFMTFFLLIFGIYFTGINIYGSYGDHTAVLSSLSTILVFAIPLVTMRLLSEERKNKTDQLLITAPIHVHDIVLGKFFSAISLLALTLLITCIQPLLLMTLGSIPIGKILTGYIGYFLLGCTLISIGLFISALTENQIIAAIGCLGTFLVFLLTDSIASLIPNQRSASLVFIIAIILVVTLILYLNIKDLYISGTVGLLGVLGTGGLYYLKAELFDGLPTKILQWFSLYARFTSFVNGLLDLSAIVYYLSFTFVFLFLTKQVIEKRSWN